MRPVCTQQEPDGQESLWNENGAWGIFSLSDFGMPVGSATTQTEHDLHLTDETADPLIRQIGERDLPQVASLLTESFPRRSRSYWETGLAKLGARPSLPGRPRYGYVIDDDGIRGVVLTISSRHGKEAKEMTLTNISSWCVAPSHRGPAAASLYAHATGDSGVTYSNLSAAPHTLKTITRLGFQEWTAGQVVGIGRGTSPDFSGIVSVEDATSKGLSAREGRSTRSSRARVPRLLRSDQGPTGATDLPAPQGAAHHSLRSVDLLQATSRFSRSQQGHQRAPGASGVPAANLDANGPVRGCWAVHSRKSGEVLQGREAWPGCGSHLLGDGLFWVLTSQRSRLISCFDE